MKATGATLILDVLDNAPAGATAEELAALVDRHPGNVRRLLGSLAQAGLVRRTRPGHHAVWSRTDRPAPERREREPRANLTTKLPRSDDARLAALAARQQRPKAAIAREALRRYLDEQERTGGTPLAS